MRAAGSRPADTTAERAGLAEGADPRAAYSAGLDSGQAVKTERAADEPEDVRGGAVLLQVDTDGGEPAAAGPARAARTQRGDAEGGLGYGAALDGDGRVLQPAGADGGGRAAGFARTSWKEDAVLGVKYGEEEDGDDYLDQSGPGQAGVDGGRQAAAGLSQYGRAGVENGPSWSRESDTSKPAGVEPETSSATAVDSYKASRLVGGAGEPAATVADAARFGSRGGPIAAASAAPFGGWDDSHEDFVSDDDDDGDEEDPSGPDVPAVKGPLTASVASDWTGAAGLGQNGQPADLTGRARDGGTRYRAQQAGGDEGGWRGPTIAGRDRG